MTRFVFCICNLFVAIFLFAQPASAQVLTYQDVLNLPVARAGQRIAYGSDPAHFGELRLPAGSGRHPVVVVLHGGCWYSEYDLRYTASMSDALTRLGVATWNLEYRRIGNNGGGWTGTFTDVAQGTDYLRTLARRYPLDLSRVIVIGHSAGGQLALWLAARSRLPPDSLLHSANPLALRGVISLAGITDLRRFRPACGDAVTRLLGGSPEQFPQRYRQTSPVELLPLRAPQVLIHGRLDPIVPLAQSQDYVAAARQRGDAARLRIIEDAGHFELVAPRSTAWRTVEDAAQTLLGLSRTAPRRRR